MNYKICKTREEDGHKIVTLETHMFGQNWISSGLLEEEVEEFVGPNAKPHKIISWKLEYKHVAPQQRLDLIFHGGLPSMLEWYWGEPYFWDAGRQGGEASWCPAEMLTLCSPSDGHIVIHDQWWSWGGFNYIDVENPHKVYMKLCRKSVDAYINNQSPADAVGYPGPNWPSTTKPGYTRRRGPAKSEVENPQQFLDDRQHKNGIMSPKSIDGSM